METALLTLVTALVLLTTANIVLLGQVLQQRVEIDTLHSEVRRLQQHQRSGGCGCGMPVLFLLCGGAATIVVVLTTILAH